MTLLTTYAELCRDQNLKQDSEQLHVVEKLAYLQEALEKKEPWLSRGMVPRVLARFFDHKHLRGFYIYGGVGRGKSMLMELFYDHVRIQKKKRYHFHEFMQMMHNDLKEISQIPHNAKSPLRHPLATLAKRLREKERLICFDEFHFKDITDAMLLKRLMHFLWKEGVIVVATSNYHPMDLYENGYQRNLIVPFLRQLNTTLEVCHLDGTHDYRQLQAADESNYIKAAFDAGQKCIEQRFHRDRKNRPITPKTLTIKGRQWILEKTAGSLVMGSFQDICGQNLGSVDYLEFAEHMDTLYLSSVPQLDDEILDQVKRFITLIDVLYDKEIKLIMAAEVSLETLYQGQKEAALFERTLSRLTEMTS